VDNKIQILVIDADHLLRDGLCALLNSGPEFQVIGAVGSTAAIVRTALPVAPDIAIVDIAVPDAAGVESITTLRNRWPHVRVLVLTFVDGLSERERDVMRRIAQGQRTREIAHALSLSHKTVEKYRSNLMRKLGLKTATAVAAYAISHGYLEI